MADQRRDADVIQGSQKEPEDTVSLRALSDEDLTYIANNPGYRAMLQDLLSPYIGGKGVSADHASTSHDGRGTDPTRPAQEDDEVEAPDQRFSAAEESADNTASRILQTIAQVLGKRGEGADSPASKRQRLEEANDTISELQEPQVFDPSLDREDKEEFRFEAPDRVGSYLEQHFRRSLSKEERTAMLRKHPKPDTKVMVPPKLDQFITDFAPRKVDKARDAALTKIQGNLLYAANPLANLWANLIQQGLDGDQQVVIPVSDVLDVVQRSLVLLGNANNLLSERRRELALEAVHPSLKKYAKGDFTQAESDLFGGKFKEELVQKVEAGGALSKAVRIVSRGTKVYQNPQAQHRGKNPLFQSRTSGYGAVFGRKYSPYQAHSSYSSSQGKGRHTTGKPYHKKGSVFERLGQQPDRSASVQIADQRN